MWNRSLRATSLLSLRYLCIFLQVVGIDLGTTNSAVAAMEGGKPTIVTNAEGVFLLLLQSLASSTRPIGVHGVVCGRGLIDFISVCMFCKVTTRSVAHGPCMHRGIICGPWVSLQPASVSSLQPELPLPVPGARTTPSVVAYTKRRGQPREHLRLCEALYWPKDD